MAGAGGMGGLFGAAAGGGMMPSDLAAAAAGTPSNLGKVGDSGERTNTLREGLH